MIENIRTLAAVLLLAAPFASQATETEHIFESLKSIVPFPNHTTITGTLLNETTLTSLTIPALGNQTDRCERLYLQMLDHPGTYLFSVVTEVIMSGGGPPDNLPPVPTTVFRRCKLEVKS
jgi:hypothetical protein